MASPGMRLYALRTSHTWRLLACLLFSTWPCERPGEAARAEARRCELPRNDVLRVAVDRVSFCTWVLLTWPRGFLSLFTCPTCPFTHYFGYSSRTIPGGVRLDSSSRYKPFAVCCCKAVCVRFTSELETDIDSLSAYQNVKSSSFTIRRRL